MVDDAIDELEAIHARVAALEEGCVRAAVAAANGDPTPRIIGDLMRLLGRDR